MKLLKISFLSFILVSCTNTEQQRAKNAFDLKGYQEALDKCREQGKMSKSYEVYESCAKAADRKFGKKELEQ